MVSAAGRMILSSRKAPTIAVTIGRPSSVDQAAELATSIDLPMSCRVKGLRFSRPASF